MSGNLFSESWYKVAEIRSGLLDSVNVQKQFYRGDLWYVLQDSFNSNYSRISAEGYHFISRLTPDKTVGQVWEECLEIYKEKAPSQEEVIHLLSALHTYNLLYFKNVPNSEFIFERHYKKKQKEFKSKILSSITSIKIPLWNPDQCLSGILPLIQEVLSVKGICVWLIVVFFGLKALIDHVDQAYDQTQQMLSNSNLIFLYLSLVCLQCFHEFSHAMMTKRFGGRVPTFGVMFFLLTPLPYIDGNSAWFFQNRWHRILVSSAGMMSDFFFAAMATMVWANTGEGLLHGLAFNIMVIGSVSSLIFNGNPLIRFDAYYILSDLLEIPNLHSRSRAQWTYWVEKYFFRVETVVAPSQGAKEAAWLALYGVGSLLYQCSLAIVIVLFVADKFFEIGLILAIISIFAGIILPLKNAIGYILSSPKLVKIRKRAVAISAVMTGAVFSFIVWYPFPYTLRVPGVIESKAFSQVYATTEGKVDQVFFESGMFVQKGAVVAILSNHELALEIQGINAGLLQTKILKQKAMYQSTADLKPLLEREKVLNKQLAFLKKKEENLTILAQHSGNFIAPDIQLLQGRWVKRQTPIGSLIPKGVFHFYAIVSQEQAFDLFREKHFKNELKFYGNAQETFTLDEMVLIPYQREELPSAALGWFGGGEISVSPSEKSGKKVTETFFELNGKIVSSNGSHSPLLLYGRSGVLRLTLPPESLAVQGYRFVKQTIQKRYRI